MTEPSTSEFGAMHGQPSGAYSPPHVPQPSGVFPSHHVPAPESVRGDEVEAGANNTGGVVRPKRRVITGKRRDHQVLSVQRNYRVSNGVQFNNLEEVFQDSISPEYAQDILEQVITKWGVPFDQPEAMKYCEDLVSAFIIAVTASDKANYSKVFDVPVKPVVVNGVQVTSVDADMAVLSAHLQRECGVTRRQFSRGMADRTRAYLANPENSHLLDDVATKVGCDRQMAYLAFDGSTHCKGMNTKEVQFTKTLESRNLFEREDQLASGASDRLLNAMTNGARAVR